MTTATKLSCGLFVLAMLTPLSSAKPLPVEAPDPGRGIIGVRVSVNSPARMGSSAADAVYFVRVTEDADRFGAESLINSNCSKGHYVYTSTFTSIERSKTAETEFWTEAIAKHFKNEPAWASRIAGRSASPVGVAAGSPSTPIQP